MSNQVHWLAQELIGRNHNVTCFSYSPKPVDAKYEHVQLVWKSASRIVRRFEPAIAFFGIRTAEFEILHFHGDDYLAAGATNRVRTMYGSAFFEAVHARNISRKFVQALFYFFELISCFKRGAVVAISDPTRGVLPRIRSTIPCGVPLDIFVPGSDAAKTEYPSLLIIGDLTSRKRGAFAWEVFVNQIKKAIPDARLVVVGPQSCDGDGIEYLGAVSTPRLVAEYQRAWIFCMVSSYEGFGVPLIEAMACGTAVVAVQNGMAERIIKNTVNGLCVGHGKFGSSCISLLLNSSLRDSVRTAGLKTAQQYDIKNTAHQYEELYRSGLKRESAT